MNIDPKIFDGIQMEAKKTDMQKGMAKSWLGDFHWVSLPTDPDKEPVTEQALAWCQEQFGTSSRRWFEKQGRFYFKDEQDLTMFILRWS